MVVKDKRVNNLPFVPFKSQPSILPLEVIACVPRGSLSGIAYESTTMGVRVTLFPTRGDRVFLEALSLAGIRFLAGKNKIREKNKAKQHTHPPKNGPNF